MQWVQTTYCKTVENIKSTKLIQLIQIQRLTESQTDDNVKLLQYATDTHNEGGAGFTHQY